MRILPKFLLASILCTLAACQSSFVKTSKTLSIGDFLRKPDVITVPYQREGDGLFLVAVKTSDGPKNFLIDTGATRSAIFKKSPDSIFKNLPEAEFANVYGLTQSGQHPLVELRDMSLGSLVLTGRKVAILPKRLEDEYSHLVDPPIGLLGMDVFGTHNLFFDTDKKTISLIPEVLGRPDIVKNWINIDLYHNPHATVDKNLHFFDLRVGNHLMPAVLDTGAEFNIINWQATTIPEIRRLKRRLRDEWEIQGAIGTFDPAVRIKVQGMKAGSKVWGMNDFIVMNFQHMDSLGFTERPLVIAGSKLLGEQSFYIDFALNQIRFQPDLNPSKAN